MWRVGNSERRPLPVAALLAMSARLRSHLAQHSVCVPVSDMCLCNTGWKRETGTTVCHPAHAAWEARSQQQPSRPAFQQVLFQQSETPSELPIAFSLAVIAVAHNAKSHNGLWPASICSACCCCGICQLRLLTPISATPVSGSFCTAMLSLCSR